MSDKRESFITEFFRLESASGIMLMIAAVAALIVANSPLAPWYGLLFDVPVEIRVGKLEIAKPLLLWINDGMMAVFFFLVGLELKRELVEGELSEFRKVVLPGLGAVGGMLVPASVYLAYNWDDPVAAKGWAIPTATDIAFALGILALLGSRVPVALKLFLTSMAIFDDIGAILVIAIFYTSKLSLTALLVAGLCLPALYYLNRRGVMERSVYLVFGIVMWVAMLKSGIHATLTGVILAMFIPLSSKLDPGRSPLKELEHDLHVLVAFFILPLFAFANAGIDLSGIGIDTLVHPVPVGIALGLFLGKQFGVFAFCWLGVRLKIARLPEGMTLLSLYGIGVLSGVGFTMSLFIGSLAFEETGVNLLFDERLGILLGSGASGVFGYLILRFSMKRKNPPD